MLQVFRELAGRPEPCPYLEGRIATTRYRVIEPLDPAVYAELLARGWRRFGRVLFRPACHACRECVSLRVEVAGFQPRRSMRRATRRNRDLHLAWGAPALEEERLDLYERYHADMVDRRGWPSKGESDPQAYTALFLEGGDAVARELTARLDGRLVLVTLVDRVPGALSAVYSFYDPDLRSRSLGVFAVVSLLERAASEGLAWVYLGYRVQGNRSMRYKAAYRPHQLLRDRPEDRETPSWRRPGHDVG